jgi:Peptidase MA superfamily
MVKSVQSRVLFIRSLRSFAAMVLMFALAAFSSLPGLAWAQGATASSASAAVSAKAEVLAPVDAPRVLERNVQIPNLPSDYQHKSVGDWLTVHYPRGTEVRLKDFLEGAEAYREQLTGSMRQNLLTKVEVRVARDWDDMARLAPVGWPPPKYAEAVAYSSLGLTLVSLSAPISYEGTNVKEALFHELAHVALYDATKGAQIPRWFNEGLAIFASGERVMARADVLGQATMTGTLIPLEKLDVNFPSDNREVSIAYAESGDVMRYLLRKGDEERFAALIARTAGGQPFDRALADAYGQDVRVLEHQWKESLGKKFGYSPLLGMSSALLGVVAAVSLIIAYMKKRKRNKVTLERWSAEEQAVSARLARQHELREQFEANQEELFARERVLGNPREDMVAAGTTQWVPSVEYDGQTHTLH